MGTQRLMTSPAGCRGQVAPPQDRRDEAPGLNIRSLHDLHSSSSLGRTPLATQGTRGYHVRTTAASDLAAEERGSRSRAAVGALGYCLAFMAEIIWGPHQQHHIEARHRVTY